MTRSTGLKRLNTGLAAAASGALLMAVGVPGAVSGVVHAQEVRIAAPPGAPLSFADLIEQVSPAVVSVNVVTERNVGEDDELFSQFEDLPGFQDFLERRGIEPDEDGNRTQRGAGLGSGFFISADGLIVTNEHVIDNAVEIEVVLDDGTELEAELVGADSATDLAVLRVTERVNQPFRYVQFSQNTNIRRGDWVVAVGNPLGFGGTATAGIVSAKGVSGSARSTQYYDYLQIDAAINRGNSGGPTFDLQGNVIGVNTAIISPDGGSIGIGFAIPADVAAPVVEKLIADGRVSRGWLGVTIQSFSDEMAEALGMPQGYGAIISSVSDDSPAESFGLKSGDIVLGLNGRVVKDSLELTRQVGALIAGTTNDFRVLRNGSERTIRVTVAERPEDLLARVNQPTAPDPDPREFEDDDVESPLGVMLAPLDEDTSAEIGLANGGLVITDLMSRGTLAEIGLDPGIVITGVNLNAVATPAQYRDAINTAKANGRQNVVLSIVTEGRIIYLSAPLDETS